MITTLLNPGGGVCPCCLAYAQQSRNASLFPNIKRMVTAKIRRTGAVRANAHMSISDPVTLEGGTVIDPRDGSVIENARIETNAGRIICVEKADTVKLDPAVRSINVTGKYIVPGYNDMHSHVLEMSDPSGSLALMLAEGITGFRQMSGSAHLLEERRTHSLPIGKESPALLQMPGSVLTPLNANSPEQVRYEIINQQKQGADFIKVGFVSPEVFAVALQEAKSVNLPILGHLQDGVDVAQTVIEGFSSIEHLGPGATLWIKCSTEESALRLATRPTPITLPSLHIPFLRKIIESRLQTLLINPAAFVPPAYIARLQHAFDTYSHENFSSLADLFVELGTWHVPTLVRLRTQEWADRALYENHADLKFMPRKNIEKWRKINKRFSGLPQVSRDTYSQAYLLQLKLSKALADAGVRMMTGSDGGTFSVPGLSLQDEFMELSNAGIQPIAILQMTTINAAEYLGRSHDMGTIEPGKSADMVILDANPLESASNLRKICGVMRAGHYFSRQELDVLKARVAYHRGYLN